MEHKETDYVVSARKYRPSTFASVVGQKALTATLKNAISNDRLAHAYLFCGSRGVGKTSCARIFAKTINCTNPTADGDPCNECDSCRAFNEGRSLNIIELDAASNNSVEDIRQLVEQVQVPPTTGRYRVFIIDEVHMLSSAAFNAFLKTLEEPPSYVVFILATTEKHKIIPTILSRCQIYDFSRITVTDMIDHLAYVAQCEGIEAERSALGVIAQKADGAMRDALSIFDQVAASSRGKITYTSTVENLNVLDATYYNRLVKAFMDKDVPAALLIYKEIRDRGFDSHQMINGLAAYLRDLMVARTGATRILVDTDELTRQEMAQLAQEVPIEFFYDAMSLCNEADLNYRAAASKTFIVELLLIRLCQLLGPSRDFSGNGEGQLQSIAAAPAAAPSAAPTPSTAPSPRPTPIPMAAQPAAQPTQAAAGVQGAAEASSKGSSGSATSISAATPPPPPPPPTSAARRVIRSTHPTATAESRPTVTAATVRTEPRRQRFTPQQLVEAWDAFAAARPRETILINTFRQCKPQPTDDPETYSLVVENPIQVDQINDLMPKLMPELRNAVSNDFIKFNISINQSGPAPHIWNDTELLHHLLATTPYLSTMIEELKLKLL